MRRFPFYHNFRNVEGGGEGGGSPTPAAPAAPAPAAPAPAAPGLTPAGPIGEGLAFREGWLNDWTGPEIAPYAAMAAQFKDLPSVFKSLKDTKTALSQRTEGMVKLPGPSATEQEWTAYRQAIGVPTKADEYQLVKPSTWPENVPFGQGEQWDSLREFSHTHGLTPTQLNALVDYQVQREMQAIAIEQTENKRIAEESAASLKRDWGTKYEQQMSLAQRAAKTIGLSDDVLALPEVARAMAQVGAMISEDKLAPAPNAMGPGGGTARDIVFNSANPLHAAYHDSSHPNHALARDTYLSRLKQETGVR